MLTLENRFCCKKAQERDGDTQLSKRPRCKCSAPEIDGWQAIYFSPRIHRNGHIKNIRSSDNCNSSPFVDYVVTLSNCYSFQWWPTCPSRRTKKRRRRKAYNRCKISTSVSLDASRCETKTVNLLLHLHQPTMVKSRTVGAVNFDPKQELEIAVPSLIGLLE